MTLSPGLEALRLSVEHELELIAPRPREWTLRKRFRNQPVLDVLIVGAGQVGLATAFGLRQARINQVMMIDQRPPGFEGPWLTHARMHDLRTSKNETGPSLGVPSLTPQAWYEARYGLEAWQNIGAISRKDWAEYLAWFRDTLGFTVTNHAKLVQIIPQDEILQAVYETPEGKASVLARKIVLATGFADSGGLNVPEVLKNLPSHLYAHSAQHIDFTQLEGKHIAVMGAGAAAFENAATALENGAASVDIFVRRAQVPRVNMFHWTDFYGVMNHYGDMPDLYRWRFSRHLLEAGHPPPAGSFKRCEPFKNFRVLTGQSWLETQPKNDGLTVRTAAGWFDYDFVICGTGNNPDVRHFSPLAAFADNITVWADRLEPEVAQENPVLSTYPYLGEHFELVPLDPQRTPLLRSIYCPNSSAQVSMGNSGGVPGMRAAVPRLMQGLVRDLFVEDVEAYYQQFIDYDAPEPDDIAFLNGGA
ncbi:FAD-dependent oxidoreductase [Gibbsiella quercinecans]|uniref:FAD-dependent oxidoreductase n=1 Tax=Gibbsiella quercinecans TaxID=929813 RepID=UPI003A4D382A